MSQVAQVNMIKQQLRTSSVTDENIIKLYERILREEFVPQQYANFAYSDMQIPLAHGQKMLTPAEEGQILQALQFTGSETVLEIGTGTGYFTALLSKLCKKVISVDIFPEFTQEAQKKLAKFRCSNVTFYTENAYYGLPQNAPYDCIIVSSAINKINDELFLQLNKGGKLIAVVGGDSIQQVQLHTITTRQLRVERFLFNTFLPQLVQPHNKNHFIF
ncbi:MAG: protein-L-isoaspartate O-methyltransferase [Legionellales bacterium RIFCSPHIGHO2_12_FULL_37_14]|nr:MAG: protein-L-isoaspartate O-methyltransferase [Legionellales bacterium RIFCSPHIGHO2_12_FULL_37_14]